MKRLISMSCCAAFMLIVSFEVTAAYLVDPTECVGKLKWNRDFTRAKCIVRNGTVTRAEGASAINFVLPVSEGQPRIEGFLRPLSKGYVLTLKADAPVSPQFTLPLLKWALGAFSPEGIEAPGGLCAKLLAEAKATF